MASADLHRCNGTATVVKRARHQPTMEERRLHKQAMSGTERSRRSRERKKEREAAEGTTKQDRHREQSKVHMQQQAIREGVEVHELHRGWRDREGRWHDIREILFMQTEADTSCLLTHVLEGERQAQAEADGAWPEFTVKTEETK